ncbi:MAG: mandelate racemase/muconate lactonizing enzyme family protein [Devosia sp.]|nr:mandelate racemase/muconate lactonizing enzyme family protein [Devosia sp.]
MKIKKIETIRIDEHANLCWVQVHTDAGLVGLGETFFGAKAVEAYIHETAAPLLLGKNPLEIDGISRALTGYLGFASTGVEMRGNSAIDIALWDLFGKVTSQPIAQLLGGFTRKEIRTYNTCAGTAYMKEGGQTVSNYGLNTGRNQYADLDAFLHRADDLAEELLAEGITAMKIWPFDVAAEKANGAYISAADLKSALSPFEKIRKRVGDQMDIMVEFHSMWQLLPAMQIARELAQFKTFWHEDPIKMDSLGDLRRYSEASRAPLCASETMATRWAFRDLLATGAAGIVMLDLSWCGGISEARKIASMAEAWHLPVAPHDCTGPVVLAASTHLSLNAPNALVQESVRAFYRTWYGDLVTALPKVENGTITVPPGPGLGMALHPDLDTRFSVTRKVSEPG